MHAAALSCSHIQRNWKGNLLWLSVFKIIEEKKTIVLLKILLFFMKSSFSQKKYIEYGKSFAAARKKFCYTEPADRQKDLQTTPVAW